MTADLFVVTEMSKSRVRWGTAVAIAAALLASTFGCTTRAAQPEPDNPGGAIISQAPDTSPFAGLEPLTPYPMPDVDLRDTSGQPFNLVTDTVPAISLVFFGYTHCRDVCPLVMSDLALSFARLPDHVQRQTQVLFITTDPARDTSSVIRAYLDRYNEQFVGLTGDLDDIVAAADTLGVAIEGKHRLPSGGYDVGHGAQVLGFDHDEAPVLWTAGTSSDDMVADIIELAGS